MLSTAHSSSPPAVRRSMTNRSISQENIDICVDKNTIYQDKAINSLKKSVTLLTTSKLGNQAPKKIKMGHEDSSPNPNPMDKLIARLTEQKGVIDKQQASLNHPDENLNGSQVTEAGSTKSSSIPITPVIEAITNTPDANESFSGTTAVDSAAKPSGHEILRLKLELEAAKGRIALMDQELAQNRITKHTIDQAIGSVSEADFPMQDSELSQGQLNLFPKSLATNNRATLNRDNSWDDTHSDASDALSASGFNRARALWGSTNRPGLQALSATIPSFASTDPLPSPTWVNRGYPQQFIDSTINYPVSTTNSFRGDRMTQEADMGVAGRRNNSISRFNTRPGSAPYGSSVGSFDGYTPSNSYGSSSVITGGAHQPALTLNPNTNIPGGIYANYQPQPIGTPLSPHAPEFTLSNTNWKTEIAATEGQTYLPTTEPLNYRRLLDRTVNCNWKYIVDKIVCNNDQQASIFLQQKLKVGTTEQKYDIVEAIVAQAYPLMINRFGNFLVQRCFEHGTPEQVIKIAEAIRGSTLNLSMDAFGCHVVQKAFDSVPEDYKAVMVHELLRRIPETVIHRYACHVWQKLFELRWTESPPQIMKYVNDALRGMWHEVALGETGSLVVQNIFENCLEEDKRPCIEEVLASIDTVAHGQFGNWCIQHICEHGAPADRSRAIDHVIRYAAEYSMDQFASKVVEKCLKIGGVEFLGRYLDRVCEGRLDRPRIPLIDIASDQYGNYLIQYILTHSNPQHREIVAQHIRKHMVSLRGSKFGSRVGMLCTNPAIQTRPGPGVGPAIGSTNPRMTQTNPRYGGAFR